MTATPAAPAATAPGPRPATGRGAPRSEVAIAAELALVAVNLAAIVGLSRLFIDNSAALRLGTVTAAGHLVAAVLRRLRVPLVLSAVISAVALVLVAGWLFHADTTWFGLPTAETRAAVHADLSRAWQAYTEVRAPAPVLPGFVLAGAIAGWIAAWIADTAAFRLWATAEAMIPGGVVFLFTSMQAAGRGRTWATAAYATAVLLFALLHRTARNDRATAWLAASPREGRWSLVRVGTALAAAGVLGGLVLGPAVPGAGQDALIAWREIGNGSGSGNGTRVTVSPLVTIRSRLVEQSDVEVFTVASAQPDYWRLTALDQFDGDVWKSSGTYARAKGELPSDLPAGTTTGTLQQTFHIEALSTLWLPAAYEPASVASTDPIDPIYEASSGTLTVKERLDDADGTSYTVLSRVPNRDPAAIRAASAPAPAEIRQGFTQLPPGFSPTASNTARRVTAAGTTPYEKARLLQDWFRTNFTYSLDVSAGHRVSDIDSFLRARRGYCEQFAGTYAAMMRSLGIPARVAVGFTPGELGSDGLYHVSGRHAHAWPEVYLTGIGWLRFEPTPGRGAPGDTAYTGAPAAQAEATDPNAAVPVPTTSAAPATTAPNAPTPAPDTGDPNAALATAGDGTAATPAPGARSSGWGGLARTVVWVDVVAALVLAATPAVALAARVRRRRQARDPRARVDLAWAETVQSLRLLDVPVRAADTPNEVAQRVAPVLVATGARAELDELAELTTRARYAPQPLDERDVAEAARLRDELGGAVARQVPRTLRWRRALDPRRALRATDGD